MCIYCVPWNCKKSVPSILEDTKQKLWNGLRTLSCFMKKVKAYMSFFIDQGRRLLLL